VEEFRIPTDEGVDLVWKVPDPEAVVQITPSGGSTDVAEAGGFDTYEVVLAAPPAANVTITLTSPDGQLTAVDNAHPANAFLEFNSGNWSTPQEVRVAAPWWNR